MIYHNNRIEIDRITLKVDTLTYISERGEFLFSFGETKLDRMNTSFFSEYGTLEMYNIYFKRNRVKMDRCSLVSMPVFVYNNWVEYPPEETDPEHFKIAIAKRNGIIEFLYPELSASLITFKGVI